MTVSAALEEAHTAWLDGIRFEAQAFARLVELMRDGTYQRGAVDAQYKSLMHKSSVKWSDWQEVVQSYADDLGVRVPWKWPNE